jgi:hypothetical protein
LRCCASTRLRSWFKRRVIVTVALSVGWNAAGWTRAHIKWRLAWRGCFLDMHQRIHLYTGSKLMRSPRVVRCGKTAALFHLGNGAGLERAARWKRHSNSFDLIEAVPAATRTRPGRQCGASETCVLARVRVECQRWLTKAERLQQTGGRLPPASVAPLCVHYSLVRRTTPDQS